MCKKLVLASLLLLLNTGCAVLHHVQLGEIDGRIANQGEKFEVMVSETGVNIDEATNVARGFTGSQQTRDQMDQIRDAIKAFQMGPRTGNIVFNEQYADEVAQEILSHCPSGKITGLMSIRETRKYPVISGEIVKITGYCIRSKT